MKLKELFDKPHKWTRQLYARKEDGHGITADSDEAVCWCLMGGIFRCYPDAQKQRELELRLGLHLGQHPINWNDTKGRTFEEVKALVEELDI